MAAMTEELSWYRAEVEHLRSRLAPHLPMPERVTVALASSNQQWHRRVVAYAIQNLDGIIFRPSSIIHAYATPPAAHWPALRGVIVHELVHLTRHAGRHHGREFYRAALVAAEVLGLPPPADPLEVDPRHQDHPRTWPSGQLDPIGLLGEGLARPAVLPSPAAAATCAVPRKISIAPRPRPCRDRSARALWVATAALMSSMRQV